MIRIYIYTLIILTKKSFQLKIKSIIFQINKGFPLILNSIIHLFTTEIIMYSTKSTTFLSFFSFNLILSYTHIHQIPPIVYLLSHYIIIFSYNNFSYYIHYYIIMRGPFSKTSQTYHNYNNFLRQEQNQKRNVTTNNFLQRNDKNIYNTNKLRFTSFQYRQSPYFSKQVQKKYSFNPSHKPILSGFKKIQNKYVRDVKPQYFQQTAINFNKSKKDKQIEDKFYETVTNGFIKNQRPISKQQSRNKTNTVKQPEDLIQINSHYIQSDAEQFDEQQKYIKDIDNDSLFFQNANLNDRPQTSKGLRKKSNTSEIHLNDDEDLLQIIEKAGNKRKNDGNTNKLENISIPIKSMYPQSQNKKYIHPTSAHFGQIAGKKQKNLDDMIKFNVSSIKKLNNQINIPFQTSLGTDFLSLFANK